VGQLGGKGNDKIKNQPESGYCVTTNAVTNSVPQPRLITFFQNKFNLMITDLRATNIVYTGPKLTSPHAGKLESTEKMPRNIAFPKISFPNLCQPVWKMNGLLRLLGSRRWVVLFFPYPTISNSFRSGFFRQSA